MDELKCKECGTILQQDMKVCPVCGCPVDEIASEAVNGTVEVKGEPVIGNVMPETPKADTKPPVKEKKPIKINVMSIIALVLGIVIIAMGAKVMKMKVDVDTYSAKHYDAEYAAIGGDFYTEIYGATDTIVDELDDINSGIATLSESIADISNTIYYPIGMMIIALGLGVVAISCIHILKEN